MYTNHHKAKCQYCGKEFDVANIKRHEAACSNPNSKLNQKKQQQHITHDGLNCQYCGKKCKHLNSLAQHEVRCPNNPNRKDYSKITDYVITNIKGTTKETNPVVAKQAEKLKQMYASNEFINPNKGKPGTFTGRQHSEQSKEKIRQTIINNRRNCVHYLGKLWANYNKDACRFIDALNETLGWHLQHAENGGEVFVGGYFLDGYDSELNIAFEYDEPRHYIDAQNNVLRPDDITRMNFIKEKLGCRFYRYNERTNTLYEYTT